MNDILLFGAGFQGSKRVTQHHEGLVSFPRHPVQAVGGIELQNGVLNFEISVFWSHENGEHYLIGVHKVDPTEKEKLNAISRERPRPFTLE